MDFNEIIALYGVDVILLTFVNVALSEVLKHTVFKNKPKVVTALVYAAAIVMYKKKVGREEALDLLAAAGGNVRKAIQ